MSYDELEAWFLNHDDPWVEKIQGAETDDEAEGIASDVLADAGVDGYEGRDLWKMVKKFREA